MVFAFTLISPFLRFHSAIESGLSGYAPSYEKTVDNLVISYSVFTVSKDSETKNAEIIPPRGLTSQEKPFRLTQPLSTNRIEEAG